MLFYLDLKKVFIEILSSTLILVPNIIQEIDPRPNFSKQKIFKLMIQNPKAVRTETFLFISDYVDNSISYSLFRLSQEGLKGIQLVGKYILRNQRQMSGLDCSQHHIIKNLSISSKCGCYNCFFITLSIYFYAYWTVFIFHAKKKHSYKRS